MSYKCNNRQNMSYKKLSLDQIGNLSIGELIDLYRQGYSLENLESYPLETSNIKTMAYSDSCIGTPTLDIYRATSQTGGFVIYKGYAMAQKIVPTSRCLDFVLFNNVKRYGNYSMHFEIRQDSSGSPSGTPGSSTGRIVDILVPYGNIPTTYGPMTVDFLTILPAANVPYWIVVYPSDYACNSATGGAGYERLEFSRSFTGSTERAAYVDMAPCRWQSLAGDAWAMEVYKLTYTTCLAISNVTANPPGPFTLGGSTTLTATVTNPTTGEFDVNFKDGTTVINPSPIRTVNRIATFNNWTPTTSKTYSIKAASGTCLSSTATSVVVNPSGSCTDIVLTASSSSVGRGELITLSATVSPAVVGTSVTFKDGTTALATRTTNASGIATYNWIIPSGSTIGSHTITAIVPGTACTDSILIDVTEAPAPSAGGGMMIIAAIALAAAIMLAKK